MHWSTGTFSDSGCTEAANEMTWFQTSGIAERQNESTVRCLSHPLSDKMIWISWMATCHLLNPLCVCVCVSWPQWPSAASIRHSITPDPQQPPSPQIPLDFRNADTISDIWTDDAVWWVKYTCWASVQEFHLPLTLKIPDLMKSLGVCDGVMKPSSCHWYHHHKVDYFPIIALPEVFFFLITPLQF